MCVRIYGIGIKSIPPRGNRVKVFPPRFIVLPSVLRESNRIMPSCMIVLSTIQLLQCRIYYHVSLVYCLLIFTNYRGITSNFSQVRPSADHCTGSLVARWLPHAHSTLQNHGKTGKTSVLPTAMAPLAPMYIVSHCRYVCVYVCI